MGDTFDVGSITARLALDTGSFQRNLNSSTRSVTRSTRRMETSFQRWGRRTRSAILNVLNPLRLFRSSLRRTSARISSFGSKAIRSFRNLRTAVLAFSAAFAGVQFAKRAEQAAQGAESFRNIAISLGTDAPHALEKMRKALRGTVSDLGLMKAVSNAAVLGVGKDIDQMGEIFAAARRLGQATGRSAEEAVQDIVVGIGRQSRLILDNLGLIVKVEKANQKYAASIGKTVAQLTQAETYNAFLQASLEAVRRGVSRLGPEVDTFAVTFQRFVSSLHNFFTEVSIRVAPSMQNLIKSFQSLNMTNFRESIIVVLNDTLNSIADWVNNNRAGITGFFDDLGRSLLTVKISLREIADLLYTRFKGFIDNPASFAEALGAQIAHVLTVLAGLVQYLSGQLVLGFLEKREVLAAFLKEMGNAFLKGVRPLFALFDSMFDDFAGKIISPLRTILNNIPGLNIEETKVEQRARELRQWKEQEAISRELISDTKRNIHALEQAVQQNINAQPMQQDAIREINEIRGEERFRPTPSSFASREWGIGDPENDGWVSDLIGMQSNMVDQPQIDMNEELQIILERQRDFLLEKEADHVGLLEKVADATRANNSILERFDEEQENFKSGLRDQIAAGAKNMEDGLDGFISNILGKPFTDFLTDLGVELDVIEAHIDNELAKRKEHTAFGFRPITTHEEFQSITDQLLVAGKTAQEIADAFHRGDLSFREVEKSVNTLISLHERISLDDRVGFDNQVRSLDELAVLQEQLLTIREAKRLYDEKEKADAEAIEDRDKDKAEAEKLLLSLIEQRAVVLESIKNSALTGDDLLKANEEAMISKIERKLDLLAIEKDLREQILVAVRALAADTTDLSHEESAVANLRALSTGLSAAIAEGLSGSDNAVRNFYRKFSRKFQEELTDVIETLASKMSKLLGDALGDMASKFFASDAFAAILGLIGILGNRKSNTSVTEEPLSDIITSSTAVRGVVAGPTSVAISEIGSSIKEANRGVESLLTEIRDTLQSIEDSGLTSGGLGQAALT